MFPVFSLVLDKDVKSEVAMLYPELYKDLLKVSLVEPPSAILFLLHPFSIFSLFPSPMTLFPLPLPFFLFILLDGKSSLPSYPSSLPPIPLPTSLLPPYFPLPPYSPSSIPSLSLSLPLSLPLPLLSFSSLSVISH